MISPEIIRGYIDLIVLEALLDEPSYGYAISKRIDHLTDGDYAIKETTLYSALRRLERQGLVSSYREQSEVGRLRTYYALTEPGLEHYRDRVEQWVATGDLVRRFIRTDVLPTHPTPNCR